MDIVIGDFAGVENKFECDPTSISNFLAIEKDVDPKYLYYKPDPTTNKILDLFGGAGKEDTLNNIQKTNVQLARDIFQKINNCCLYLSITIEILRSNQVKK